MKIKKVFLRIKEDKRGDAMLVVLGILVLLIALSVALLMSVSTAIGAAEKSATGERCRAMAISFNELLIEEMESFDKTGIKDYVKHRFLIREWDSDEIVTMTTAAQSDDGEYFELGEKMQDYNVETELKWIEDPNKNYTSEADYNGVELVITVKAMRGKEVYQIETHYILNITSTGVWTWEKEA